MPLLETLALGFGALSNCLFGTLFLFMPAFALKNWELNADFAPGSLENLVSMLVQALGIAIIFTGGMALYALVLDRQLARPYMLLTVVTSVLRLWKDFDVARPYVLARAPLDESNWSGGAVIHVIDLMLCLSALLDSVRLASARAKGEGKMIHDT